MHTSFSRERWAQFKEDTRPGPIHMLNLIRLRDHAQYEDGRDATGLEAYNAYGKLSEPVFRRIGGRIVWRGRFEMMMIGPDDEHWDICFIAEYPSVQAFIEMIGDPAYRAAMEHRQAGVADSRLERFMVEDSGRSFSG